jgi:hypothetical protein
MASDLNEKQRREALVADIIAVVKSTKDRWFYTGIVDRIPELHIRAVLKKIQTEPERAIGHPGAYFFNEIVSFAETLGIELPEPVNNDCAVPLYQDGRSGSEPTPFLCLPHMAEFQHFKPESCTRRLALSCTTMKCANRGCSRYPTKTGGCMSLSTKKRLMPCCMIPIWRNTFPLNDNSCHTTTPRSCIVDPIERRHTSSVDDSPCPRLILPCAIHQ